jgi:hypothetical protein
LWIFGFFIAVAAHWFACIWCMVAYIQLESWDATVMLDQKKPNWIGLWYKNNYEPGGLDPLGWHNDSQRYVLSLFWAIQTMTSIGYGNIMPLTPIEWWVGSILQLMAGMFWAYIIGGLVGVVTAMAVKNELFRARIDEANQLISVFLPEEQEKRNERMIISSYRRRRRRRSNNNNNNNNNNSTTATSTNSIIQDDHNSLHYGERKRLATRIRRYIYTQSERPVSSFRYQSNMEERFPVLTSLPPELCRSSTLMVVRRYLQEVPYLSSRFLSFHAQSLVAQRCVFLEFPPEEVYRMDKGVDGYGRGVLVQNSGLLWRTSKLCGSMPILSGGVVGDGHVLLSPSSLIQVDGDDDVKLKRSKR